MTIVLCRAKHYNMITFNDRRGECYKYVVVSLFNLIILVVHLICEYNFGSPFDNKWNKENWWRFVAHTMWIESVQVQPHISKHINSSSFKYTKTRSEGKSKKRPNKNLEIWPIVDGHGYMGFDKLSESREHLIIGVICVTSCYYSKIIL